MPLKLYLEFHWCSINAGFFLERLGINGQFEDCNVPDKDNSSIMNTKKEIFGFKIVGDPISV